MLLNISIPIEMPKLEKMAHEKKMPTINDILPYQMPGIPPLKTGILPIPHEKKAKSGKREVPVIDLDASNLLAEILKVAASEIVQKANKLAHDDGRNVIEIVDIENAIHELEG